MDQMVSDQLCPEEALERVRTALGKGAIMLDSNREIVWMDERTQARLNGGAERLAAILRLLNPSPGIHCCLSVREVTFNGEATTVCLIQECEAPQAEERYDTIAALEAAMADTSWFTRAIIERLTAFRQTNRSVPRTSDLDILSDREREVLVLICEGRSDAEMGIVLNLSQNTIRNHIASLYRKIGVNRRSAAVIWVRERGITAQDALPRRRRLSPRHSPPPQER